MRRPYVCLQTGLPNQKEEATFFNNHGPISKYLRGNPFSCSRIFRAIGHK